MDRLLLSLLLMLPAGALASNSHFQQWYPQYRATFERLVDGPECNGTFADYRRGYGHPGFCWPNFVGCLSGAMVHCLLSNVTESLKANMASAAIFLGLLPTTLSLVGPSTVETGLLALRRPLLSLLLASGAPAVSPIRTFEYRLPAELIRKRPDGIDAPRFTSRSAAILASLEYLFACAAVVNLAHVSWELGFKTVCSFSSETNFLPALWTFLALSVHIIGTVAVILRVSCKDLVVGPAARRRQSWYGYGRQLLRCEFQLAVRQPAWALELKRESYAFIFCSWCTSVGTVLHIIYGTAVFSSILFISTQDALSVFARYLASTLVCRAILAFEIGGMREVVEIETEHENESRWSESDPLATGGDGVTKADIAQGQGQASSR